MEMQFRDAIGGSIELVGEIADLDSRSHRVQVKFPHEVVDTFKTTFGPEAFRDSFDASLPIMCWQHDMRDPIGRCERAQVLATHNELTGKFSDIDAVPNAKRAFAQISDGTITDFSFGYTDGKEFPHPDPKLRKQGVRQIPKARMREFSPVSIGSIPGAVATGVRQEGLVTTFSSPGEIAALVEAGIMTREEGQLAIIDHFPELAQSMARRAIAGAPTVGDGRPSIDGSNKGPQGIEGKPGSPSEFADRAEDELEAAKEARAAGDDESAHQHATAARMHARNALKAGDPTDEDDVNHMERAQAAAAQAENMSIHAGRGDAQRIMVALRKADPKFAETLDREGIVAVAPRTMQVLFRAVDGTTTDAMSGQEVELEQRDDEAITGLAQAVGAALGSAVEWMSDVDVRSLPDDVQQAMALVSAASTASEALLDAMGVETEEGLREPTEEEDEEGLRAAGYSTKPWSSFKESDYSPEQWKSACLVDSGEGDEDSKDRYKLPIKEPGGAVNANGVSAAASRINQTQAPAEKLKAAARKLMGHYRAMKKPAPANVLRILGKGTRALEDEAEEAIDILDKIVTRTA